MYVGRPFLRLNKLGVGYYWLGLGGLGLGLGLMFEGVGAGLTSRVERLRRATASSDCTMGGGRLHAPRWRARLHSNSLLVVQQAAVDLGVTTNTLIKTWSRLPTRMPGPARTPMPAPGTTTTYVTKRVFSTAAGRALVPRSALRQEHAGHPCAPAGTFG